MKQITRERVDKKITLLLYYYNGVDKYASNLLRLIHTAYKYFKRIELITKEAKPHTYHVYESQVKLNILFENLI